MKPPSELAKRLARQWQKADLRETRLLEEGEAWPVTLTIPPPSAKAIQHETPQVKAHLDRWRAVKIGEVKWQEMNYRATSHSIEIPSQWVIHDASQWIAATSDEAIRKEYKNLQRILADTDPLFHPLLIRRRPLWQKTPMEEVIQATRLALALEPGCAQGRPLRALSLKGIDTKFFERNDRLIIALLDVRYDGEASHRGLEEFLGAHRERDHWLLVLDLDGGLLPFPRLRISSSDLAQISLPGSHLLIVENEACQHQLSSLPDTIAILGSGFDLSWTQAPWLSQKTIAYWGDLDTWGLELLGKARQNQPHLTSLLMDFDTFQSHCQKAVPEPTPASPQPHPSLLGSEQSLYTALLATEKGRLEQEFISRTLVVHTLRAWRENSKGDDAL